MSKSVKAVKNAPSVKAQKRAFLQAQVDMNETPFGELTNNAKGLLVSKGGKKLSAQLLDQLGGICHSYPVDVVAHASLQLAGSAFSGYIALLDLNRAK